MYKIYIDLETSGLSELFHDVLEIGLIIEDGAGREVAEYSSFIQRGALHILQERANAQALKINGITLNEEFIQISKPVKEIQHDLIALFQKFRLTKENAVFVANNPQFDMTFLGQIVPKDTQAAHKWPYRSLDLHTLAYAKLGKLGMSKDKVAEFVGLEPEPHPHRAINGTRHLRDVIKRLEKLDVKN